MAELGAIQGAVAAGNYRFSQHARRQMSARHITVGEVEAAIASGMVIEDYPDDKYRPSCLILGYTPRAGRCTCNAATRSQMWWS